MFSILSETLSLASPTLQANRIKKLRYSDTRLISVCKFVLSFFRRTPLKGYSAVDGSERKSSPTRQPSSGDSLKENQCDSNTAGERQAKRISEHARNVKKALQMKRSSSTDL